MSLSSKCVMRLLSSALLMRMIHAYGLVLRDSTLQNNLAKFAGKRALKRVSCSLEQCRLSFSTSSPLGIEDHFQ